MNILFIDDDEEDTQLFMEVIHDLDSDIQCTSISSHKQLESDFRQLPTPDIIFLDGHFGPLTPHEAFHMIENLTDPERTKIYIHTGSVSILEAKEYQQAGINGVLLKGVSYNDIRDNFSRIIKLVS